jgi:diaminopimelate decarboxylase
MAYKQHEYSRQGDLLFYGQNVNKWLKSKKTDTPVYLYSRKVIRAQAKTFLSGVAGAHHGATRAFYALKANSNLEILRTLRLAGLGIDAVSAGEIRRGLSAGFSPDQIIFSGVGKTTSEIEFALKKDILQINAESVPELERILSLTKALKKSARIALRFNPAVNPKTHPYIATGFRENKFGIDRKQLPAAMAVIKASGGRVQFQGLSMHIGSQLFDFSSLGEAIVHARTVTEDLAGQGFPSVRLDVGGGLGVDYHKNSEQVDPKFFARYLQELKKGLKGFRGEVCFEPGRAIVARSGMLLGQVQYLKRTPHKNFLVLNTGMHHLLRPSLYQAFHRVVPVVRRAGATSTWDIVGPVCESSDVIGTERRFGPLQELDWVGILDAGAYGFSMASDYNSFGLPEESFID